MEALTLITPQFIFVDNPLVPVFHHLQKLHKNTVPVQVQPIVAGIGSLFERLGEWIESHHSCINFLDITLTGDTQTCSVWSHTFRKDCAGNSLLLATSCHPSHTIRSVPVGEFVRAKRNCADDESFLHDCGIISIRLRDRGYNQWLIDRARALASKKERWSLLPNTRYHYQ